MKKLLTKWDISLILLLLLAGVGFFLFRPDTAAGLVRIEQDGELLYEISLADLTEAQILELDTTPPATITVTKDGAYFSSAHCPDQTCVRTGTVSRPGELACCLPARLVVRVVSPEKDRPALDAITG